MFYSKTTNKVWLEASTERSESNLGRSLRITRNRGTAVWKTVPISKTTKQLISQYRHFLTSVSIFIAQK